MVQEVIVNNKFNHTTQLVLEDFTLLNAAQAHMESTRPIEQTIAILESLLDAAAEIKTLQRYKGIQ